MKKLGILIAFPFVLLVMLTACSSDVIFDQRVQFKDYKWNYFEPAVFTIEITDTENSYDLYASLRHTSQIPYEEIPVLIVVTSPSGTVRSFPHVFKIKNYEGSFLGNGMGDLWDVEDKLKEYFFFSEKGKYEIKINSNMQYLETICLMDIGLKIKKSKINYNLE